ncbi:MAG: hypothetical protein AAGG11_16285 [Pseudomonadota bacterium]
MRMQETDVTQAPQTPQAFEGGSVREVLATIRETLGRDALILDQERSAGRVTMTAMSATDAASTQAQQQAGEDALTRETQGDAGTPIAPARTLYREHLEALAFAPPLLDRLPPATAGWKAVFDTLIAQLPLAGPFPRSGAIRFIGPRGAGVSTALLRFAGTLIRGGCDARRLVLAHCGDPGIARDEALARAALLLSAHHLAADTPQLKATLEHAHPETLLLLDESTDDPLTLGGRIADDPLTPELWVWVLPAHWRSDVLERWLARADRVSRPTRQCVVISHLDREVPCGAWMSVLAARRLPLAAVQATADPAAPIVSTDEAWLRECLRSAIDRNRAATTFRSGEPAVEY